MKNNQIAKPDTTPKTNLFIVQSRKFDARDVPAHLELKTREKYQRDYNKHHTSNFTKKLEKEENKLNDTIYSRDIPSIKKDFVAPRNLKQKIDREQSILNQVDEDDPELIFGSKKRDESNKNNKKSEKDSDSSDNSEDDEALIKEFDRIKKEREEEEKLREEEIFKKKVETASVNDSFFTDNTYSLRKRWFEDSLFKNQNNGKTNEENGGRNNDILRSGYHRKFLKKFIQS